MADFDLNRRLRAIPLALIPPYPELAERCPARSGTNVVALRRTDMANVTLSSSRTFGKGEGVWPDLN